MLVMNNSAIYSTAGLYYDMASNPFALNELWLLYLSRFLGTPFLYFTAFAIIASLPRDRTIYLIPRPTTMNFISGLSACISGCSVSTKNHTRSEHSDHQNPDHQRNNHRLLSALHCMHKDLRENSFSSFRDRLLLANRVWQQEREIKSLRQELESTKALMSKNSFASFRDRLLLANKAWQQERENKMLRFAISERDTELEALRRLSASQVSVLEQKVEKTNHVGLAWIEERATAEAKKDTLIEGLVNELIEELEGCKKEIGALRAARSAHEREIEEIHHDWIQDNRKLSREVAELKLAQRARLVEQEVSNDLEEALFLQLRGSTQTEEAVIQDEVQVDSSQDVPHRVTFQLNSHAKSSGSDSSASTCVSSDCESRSNRKPLARTPPKRSPWKISTTPSRNSKGVSPCSRHHSCAPKAWPVPPARKALSVTSLLHRKGRRLASRGAA
jgi:hypothetical protein